MQPELSTKRNNAMMKRNAAASVRRPYIRLGLYDSGPKQWIGVRPKANEP
jgi:hypothetical protein